MKLILVVICTFLFTVGKSHAQKQYDFNAVCQQAYQEITRLRISSGEALIAKAKAENPNNLIPVLLESYADFLVLFLNEDPAFFKTAYPGFLDKINQLEEGPSNSPFYRFCLANVRFHRAAVAIKFGKTWDAGWDFRRAWLFIKENQKKFPGFVPDDLLYGALQAAVGTIPKGYKWLAGLLGMRASMTDGIKTVRNFVYSNDPWAKIFANEANFIYPYLLFYLENKKEEAIQFIQQKKLDLVNNHLHGWMAANLGLNNKQSVYAIGIINNRNKSSEYLNTPVWDFEMGYARLFHLEIPEALRYFTAFTTAFKGRFYLKDVYQKISWCYYLQGNMTAAEQARQLVLSRGSTDTDADKQALKDARSGNWPNPLLLRARLLSDGGYHHEALALLHGKSDADFEQEEERLEFVYRAARIFDDLGRDEEAIKAYQNAIRLGEFRKEYFAARAAVQLGQLYEARGQKAEAIRYYQQCLDMGDHEFKNSLDQRAKSGILRCKGE
jgi:tetratricopeptide (TPR) repeat protein